MFVNRRKITGEKIRRLNIIGRWRISIMNWTRHRGVLFKATAIFPKVPRRLRKQVLSSTDMSLVIKLGYAITYSSKYRQFIIITSQSSPFKSKVRLFYLNNKHLRSFEVQQRYKERLHSFKGTKKWTQCSKALFKNCDRIITFILYKSSNPIERQKKYNNNQHSRNHYK